MEEEKFFYIAFHTKPFGAVGRAGAPPSASRGEQITGPRCTNGPSASRGGEQPAANGQRPYPTDKVPLLHFTRNTPPNRADRQHSTDNQSCWRVSEGRYRCNLNRRCVLLLRCAPYCLPSNTAHPKHSQKSTCKPAGSSLHPAARSQAIYRV